MKHHVTLAMALLVVACGRRSDRETSNGTVEIHEHEIAATTAARVVEMRVAQGDRVRAGDTLAILTVSDASAQLAQLRAQVASARAALADLRAGPQRPELQRARAEVAAADADAARLRNDADRAERLLSDAVISRSDAEAAATAARVAAERASAARADLRLLEAGTRPNRIREAEAGLQRAEAGLQATSQRLGELVLTAPVDGVVLSRNAETGEVLAAGMSAVTLGDDRHPYVEAWVPQRMLAVMAPGRAARVTPSGWEGQSVAARVQAVMQQAAYTPRVALTDGERADLMFEVRLALDSVLPAGVWVTVHWDPTTP